ncbi:5'-3' exonuclease [Vibrio phage 3.058.O._10N.286.46.B8]|nr:5'-3' exonuclease [Vibrio phage 2.058.O._10N.286.46.B8]AUS03169.1 5'-3' exonuclease [Vibrio phage 3.058.O._10N.286.46.B8]
MPIILDVSGTMYAALHVDLVGGAQPQLAYIRHLVLNSILFTNKKFKDEYGELIIAFDNSSWRKRFFPNYKWVRYNGLEDDGNDWEYIHQCMEKISADIMEHFPYPCVRVKYAEGDDVIGVLTDKFTAMGEKVMIVSGDKDMVMKTKHSLCQQYRPVQRIMYEVDNPVKHEFDLIIKGDKADGIPNIFCDDDFYKNQYMVKQRGEKTPRAPSVSKKLLDDFWGTVYNKPHSEDDIKMYLDKVSEEFNAKQEKKATKDKLPVPPKVDTYTNFCRNRKLISLNEIPDVIRDAVLTSYNTAGRNGIMKTLGYMQQNNMHILAKEIKGFEPKFKPHNSIF